MQISVFLVVYVYIKFYLLLNKSRGETFSQTFLFSASSADLLSFNSKRNEKKEKKEKEFPCQVWLFQIF